MLPNHFLQSKKNKLIKQLLIISTNIYLFSPKLFIYVKVFIQKLIKITKLLQGNDEFI